MTTPNSKQHKETSLVSRPRKLSSILPSYLQIPLFNTKSNKDPTKCSSGYDLVPHPPPSREGSGNRLNRKVQDEGVASTNFKLLPKRKQSTCLAPVPYVTEDSRNRARDFTRRASSEQSSRKHSMDSQLPYVHHRLEQNCDNSPSKTPTASPFRASSKSIIPQHPRKSSHSNLDVGRVAVASHVLGKAPSRNTHYLPALNVSNSPHKSAQAQTMFKKVSSLTMDENDCESEDEELYTIPECPSVPNVPAKLSGKEGSAARSKSEHSSKVESPKKGNFSFFASRVIETNRVVSRFRSGDGSTGQSKSELTGRSRRSLDSVTQTAQAADLEKVKLLKNVKRLKALYTKLVKRCDNGKGTVTMAALEEEIPGTMGSAPEAYRTFRKAINDPQSVTFEMFLLLHYPKATASEIKRMVRSTMPIKVAQEQKIKIVNDDVLYDLSDLWDKWDVDGNGELDRYEFQQAMRTLGIDDRDQFDAIFEEIDTSMNNSIDKAEFMAWYIYGDSRDRDLIGPISLVRGRH